MSKDVGELATIPIRYEGQRKERLVLLEFQGALSVSRMDTETGEVANSENLESFDGVVIGQLVNFGSLSKNLCDPGVEFPREAPVELKVGYHTLKGKLVKLGKPLAIIQNLSKMQESGQNTLNIYDIINFKLVFESRPSFSS